MHLSGLLKHLSRTPPHWSPKRKPHHDAFFSSDSHGLGAEFLKIDRAARMSLLLPDHATLYTAFVARDASYDGRVLVGVYTAGVFCKLTCLNRKPDAESCQFFETVADCLSAGLRPCKRCYPLGGVDTQLAPLIAALESAPAGRWTEADVGLMRFDPTVVRRSSKRFYGLTFLEMARLRRLQSGFTTTPPNVTANDPHLDPGFENHAEFHAEFARLSGVATDDLRGNARLQASWIATPLGDMIAVGDRAHLYLLEFIDRKALPAKLSTLIKDAKGDIGTGELPATEQVRNALDQYFAGTNPAFSVPLATGGSALSQSVWRALRKIPAGETQTYSKLAAEIGQRTAVLTVARANGANRLVIVVPCHRILDTDGSLNGYGVGLWRKDMLLSLERGYQMTL